MPDNPLLLQEADLASNEYVFTGHFHMRQQKGPVTYIGNCMPHDFSDANDDNRGCMLLEWDQPPIYDTWPDQPVYRTAKLSALLEDPDRILKPKATVKIAIDVDISHEETMEIKTQLMEAYSLRRFEFLPLDRQDTVNDVVEDADIKTVDQVIIENIRATDSTELSITTLEAMYQSLDEDIITDG
jgi:hypothetical protein